MIELVNQKKTIINLLEKAATNYKDDNYVTRKTDDGWESYSYSEVWKKVNYLAAALLDNGFQQKQNFAILSEGSPMWVISEYAVLAINGVSVPLSVKLLPEELPYRLNHSECQGIFTSKNHLLKVISILPKVENKEMKIIYLDEDTDYFWNELDRAGVDKDRGVVFWEALDLGKEKQTKFQGQLTEIKDNIDENDIVNISYTSGTTGNPKGIMLTHLNYYSNAKDGVTVFKLRKNFRTLIILPVDHCFAHTVALYGALFKALDLYFLDARGGVTNAIKNIPINLQEVKPQFLLTVPALSGNFINKMTEGVKAKGAFIERLFTNGLMAGKKRNGDGFTKPGIKTKISTWFSYNIASKLIFSKLSDVFGGELEFMVGGGALLDLKQQQFYKSIGTPIYQGYGLTEAAPIISSNTPFEHKMGTSGRVMPNVTCKVMDNETEEAQVNQIGEIVIQGENVMKGYYKNEEASSLALRDNWLWTGDLAYYDQDGFLVVTGRNKALLISEDGEKYSPEGIEEAIVNCSEIFTHVMLYCNQNKVTTAIVSIDPAKKSLISKGSAEDTYRLIQDQFSAFSRDETYKDVFQKKWIPKTFYIAPEPFTEANLMVNSTLKMVRYKITEAYQNKLDIMNGVGGSKKIKQINLDSLK